MQEQTIEKSVDFHWQQRELARLRQSQVDEQQPQFGEVTGEVANIRIGIEEDRVFGASVSSEFLPELSKLFLDRPLGFSVQRNSLQFAFFGTLEIRHLL